MLAFGESDGGKREDADERVVIEDGNEKKIAGYNGASVGSSSVSSTSVLDKSNSGRFLAFRRFPAQKLGS